MRAWPGAIAAALLSLACDARGRVAPSRIEPAALAGDGGAGQARPSSGPADAGGPEGCVRAAFAPSVDLAEASGAVHVGAAGGVPAHVVVVADSGNAGAFAVIDARDGSELGRGALPLDRLASDDHEGFARAGDVWVALTSSGRARYYQRRGLIGFVLERRAQPIGPIDGDLVCREGRSINCGRNWEGLCLRDPPPTSQGACAGFAASKRDGELVCLYWRDGVLRADPTRAIAVAGREALTGCAFGDADTVYAGTNLFGGSMVYRVTGVDDPERARVEPLGRLGSGFPEAIAAAPGGILFRFSDMNGRPSLMDRFTCSGPAPTTQ
jgi:hypothetical protein